jgi:hypothetical protein
MKIIIVDDENARRRAASAVASETLLACLTHFRRLEHPIPANDPAL